MKNNIKTSIKDFSNKQFENTDSMKELIKKALNEAYILAKKQAPKTRKKTKHISISDVKPLDITKFMTDNNIPTDAYFSSTDEYDIVLEWEVDVPTTEDEKISSIRGRFDTVAFRKVYDLLTENGYERVGYSTRLLKDFKDTTVYDMYIDKDFNKLVKYYSLPFEKTNK